MALSILIALGFWQAKPKLVAVQVWKGFEPVRAWSPYGTEKAKTFSIDRPDGGFPDKPGAVEIIAEVDCSSAEEFPFARWSNVKGLGDFYPSSTWQDNDPKSKHAIFGLLGYPKSNEASVVLELTKGPQKPISQPTLLHLNRWKKIAGGFRARVRNRIIEQQDGMRAEHAFVELILPARYENWDVEPVISSSGSKALVVGFNESGRDREFTLMQGVDKTVQLVIVARPFVAYPFSHIRLKPR